MGSFNKFIGMGNLARDPELRYLDSGTAVCNFAIAMNRKWKDDRDEVKEEVCFLECNAWSGRAETIAEYFKQGDPIHVFGYLKQETWEDKETDKKRSKIVLVIEGFTFCGDVSGEKKKNSRDRDSRSRREDDERPRGGKDKDRGESSSRKEKQEEEDDVPF
jgi:single-strand DNA-binding protein